MSGVARRLQFEWVEAQMANLADLDDNLDDNEEDDRLEVDRSPFLRRPRSRSGSNMGVFPGEQSELSNSAGRRFISRVSRSASGLLSRLRRSSRGSGTSTAQHSDAPPGQPQPTEHVPISLVRISSGVLLGCCVRWPTERTFPLIVSIEEGGVLHQAALVPLLPLCY